MEDPEIVDTEKKRITEGKIFPVPFSIGEIEKNIPIKTYSSSKPSKQQIISKAFQLHSQGNILGAAKYYEYFINQGFLDHNVFCNYGVILQDLKKFKEAEILTRKAIQLKPDYADSHSNLGKILEDLGKYKEAEVSTRKAIQLNPSFANAHYILGNILKELGKLKEAEISTRKAIQLNPNLADAHLTLGSILKELVNYKEAEISTRKAIELKPDYAKAYEGLGLILLNKGSQQQSLKYFSKSAKLLKNPTNKEYNNQKYKTISKAKVRHDIEQFEYLVSKGQETNKFTNLAKLYKQISSEIIWNSETALIPLSRYHQSLLNDNYNMFLHQIEAPRLNQGAVSNSLDVERITNSYFDHEFGLTYIDNFLNPTALACLRKFLLESTIWFNIKPNGYLGAFLREGFANPLIFQIADELRKKFPKIFKNYPINHIWAFKYDSRTGKENPSLKGINVHADFAAVNVNFWITPNEANLNSKSGGLVIYDVEAPIDWDFQTFNNDEKRIREELKKTKGNTRVVSHQENRAVVFNSNLFHESDSYEFKEGYENRRINVTILFGDRMNK